MKKTCVISMLILSIVGNAFCQKNKSKHDTVTVLEGIRPPILVNDFSRKSDLYFNEEIKKNTNNLIIDFGNKNRLLIDYQGVSKFELKHNVDSLLHDFWNDYSLIRDTLKRNMVKKITYFGKNKNVNRKAMIDVQYFPQKEVFQFGKEVELVRLQQDTLVLINFDDKATAELAKTANRVFKTYEKQSFLFNLNSIEDIEAILEININRAIAETTERAETERKTVKPWKILGVVNDLASQRIKSKIKGNALFDMVSFHADIGIGLNRGGDLLYSSTAAIDFVSSKYYKKGLVIGLQSNEILNKEINFTILNKPTFFTGVSFYKKKENRNEFKGGLFLGISKEERFTLPTTNQPAISFMQTRTLKFFGWYQLTPLIRLQPEINFLQFKKINPDFKSNPVLTKPAISSGSNIGFRLSFGI